MFDYSDTIRHTGENNWGFSMKHTGLFSHLYVNLTFIDINVIFLCVCMHCFKLLKISAALF